jgi:hypothetical protein
MAGYGKEIFVRKKVKAAVPNTMDVRQEVKECKVVLVAVQGFEPRTLRI